MLLQRIPGSSPPRYVPLGQTKASISWGQLEKFPWTVKQKNEEELTLAGGFPKGSKLIWTREGERGPGLALRVPAEGGPAQEIGLTPIETPTGTEANSEWFYL